MKKITVTGLVQGVGFRPFVQREAEKFSLTGTVKNTGGIVEILADGTDEALEKFIQCLSLNAPAESIIESISVEDVQCVDEHDSFEIISSDDFSSDRVMPVIPADIATCDTCLTEMLDPGNRRFMHPFISCTVCGPRYSIIKKLPYDRHNTLMDKFPMCASCAGEYDDTSDRRCYAQTVACNDCGPVLEYMSEYALSDMSPIENAARDIQNGGIVAVKDIGGYHFACSAFDEKAVTTLRELKGREKKPFAVMFGSVDEIREYAAVSPLEEKELLSPARPIVLVEKIRDFSVQVCGISGSIGAFLPCNPVQHMLIKTCGPLVMTSGNFSDRPIIIENKEIFDIYNNNKKLTGVLHHNRDIMTPLDDSIVRVVSGRIQLVRRGRGYTPLPVGVADLDKSVFAAGGDMKSSFCIASGRNAYMSQHMGDLDEQSNADVYLYNTERLKKLTGIEPEIYAADPHPLYRSREIAEEHGRRVAYVQHHIAHAASVIAEHGIEGDALCFSFDGTGYGDDGTVWGGEVFEYRKGVFSRCEHLAPVEMTGGDNISKDAGAAADCYLIDAGFEPRCKDGALIKAAISMHINTVKSSSMGRLFDGVCAMLGICDYNDYEGLCATMLEVMAGQADKAYPLALPVEDGLFATDKLIKQIKEAADKGIDTSEIALGFHNAIINAVAETAKKHNIKSIALSGGVFMNRILTEGCIDRLTAEGFQVYINQQVPTNDGGIALGQAFAAVKSYISKKELHKNVCSSTGKGDKN
ncbi:MAG: carbamoyltransferase HypF [Clostridia bacterium]|nr:carbamoyltransferase HypF [Clostridia bacterium]